MRHDDEPVGVGANPAQLPPEPDSPIDLRADDRAARQQPGLGPLPAVVVAMHEEIEPLLALCGHHERPLEVGGTRVYRAELGGRDVLLGETGLGLVNAASAATVLVARFGATALLSAGSAGGMAPGVRVGDIVIGTRALFSAADATAFGHYELGQIPRMPADYRASHRLVGAAASGGHRFGAHGGGAVHRGLIVSADSFVWERNFAQVSGTFPGALAADMETAAIAQVAYVFTTPWVAVRAISDLCGPQAAGEFVTHIDDAASISAQAVQALLASG